MAVTSNALRDGSHGVGIFGESSSDSTVKVNGAFNPATKRFLVDAVTSIATVSSVAGATATVASSGTAVQLGNNACSQVFIIANASNTGVMYVGGSNVLASSKNGIELEATGSFAINVTNTNLLYIDSTHSGDTISYLYAS